MENIEELKEFWESRYQELTNFTYKPIEGSNYLTSSDIIVSMPNDESSFFGHFQDVFQDLKFWTFSHYSDYKSLMFFDDDEDAIKKFFPFEKMKLKNRFQSNPYPKNYQIDISDFPNNLRDISTIRDYFNMFKNRNYAKNKVLREQSKILSDVEYHSYLEDELKELDELFDILNKKAVLNILENEILKVKVNLVKTKSPKFNRNQKIILLEQLGMLNQLENLSTTAQSEIISCIIDRSSDNIKTSLQNLSKSRTKAQDSDNQKVENYLKELGVGYGATPIPKNS